MAAKNPNNPDNLFVSEALAYFVRSCEQNPSEYYGIGPPIISAMKTILAVCRDDSPNSQAHRLLAESEKVVRGKGYNGKRLRYNQLWTLNMSQEVDFNDLNGAQALARAEGAACQILVYYMASAVSQNYRAAVSAAELQEELNIGSRHTVTKSLRWLIENGYIADTGGRYAGMKEYMINPVLFNTGKNPSGWAAAVKEFKELAGADKFNNFVKLAKHTRTANVLTRDKAGAGGTIEKVRFSTTVPTDSKKKDGSTTKPSGSKTD